MVVNRWSLIIVILMVGAATLAATFEPTQRLSESRNAVDLERLIPQRIGEWRIDDSIVPLTPAPDVQAKLDKIYGQVLARTYVNPAGRRIMLSIAYGSDQSDGMRVHRPEVCYAAQGFDVSRPASSILPTQFGSLPVNQLTAIQGRRIEPITYWIVVGETATLPGLKQKLAQIRYGLSGKIPDGVLVRLSSIDDNRVRAYELQTEFARSMLSAINASDRARIAGNGAG